MSRYEYEYDNDEQEDVQQPSAADEGAAPLSEKLGFGMGTFLLAGGVDLVAHFGLTGLVVGGIAAYAASRHGPDLLEQVRGALPTRPASPPSPRARGTRGQPRSQRSILDRALGRFPDAPGPLHEVEDDTGLVAEADLSLPDTLALGSLHPHADTVFSHRMVILGMPGAGKSNLVAVLVEELGQYDAPLIVFDHKPEYDPLCQHPYLSNPVHLSARSLTQQNATATAQQIMERRWQVVLDLSSYASDAEAAYVMTELIAGVLRHQKERGNAERVPCTFVLDEAHYWLPEHEGHSTIRGRNCAPGNRSCLTCSKRFLRWRNWDVPLVWG